MREIGILIIDFSFPEEETSRAQHLNAAHRMIQYDIVDVSIRPFKGCLGFMDSHIYGYVKDRC